MPESMNYVQEEAAARKEAQEYATQQAFLLLLGRQLNEYQHLGEILRKTTEQAIDFVQASGGEIWLLSPYGSLELSFSTLPLFNNDRERETWKNVPAKWAIIRKQVFRTGDSANDPRLAMLGAESLQDAPPMLMSIPLIVREKVIGAMTLYNVKNRPFSQKDEVLAQDVADLASPVIANVLARQKLQQQANQQKALFEMSLQIAGDLDLQTTLDRALQWVDRIATVEIGLLWLVDVEDKLHCLAVLGISSDAIKELPVFSLSDDDAGCTSITDKKLTVLDPWEKKTPFHAAMSAALRTPIRNMISIPMFNREHPLGVICLFNRVGGGFVETDMTMLSIAAQMIGIAISNAQLYNRSLDLTTEREQYYKIAIQRERLAAIGRLMSSLSHEINNPLQAVRGALALAIEDINDPEELKLYFDIMQREVSRVVQLLARMRQIYRPSNEGMQQLDVNRILLETFALTGKELSRHKTTIENDLAIQVPPITGEASQIHLAFLNILLSLGDAIETTGGGALDVLTRSNRTHVEIIFSAKTKIPQWEQIFSSASSHIQTGTGFSLLLSREIILAHEGELDLEQGDARTLLTVSLPLHEIHYPPASIGESR